MSPAAVAFPSFSVKPDNVQIFCFSAVTWNPHRIHYDAPYTIDVEGHPGIVVQGPLFGAWLLELAQKWVADWGKVEAVTYRNIRSGFAGEEFEVTGEVEEPGESPRARIWVLNKADGGIVCEGSVTASRL